MAGNLINPTDAYTDSHITLHVEIGITDSDAEAKTWTIAGNIYATTNNGTGTWASDAQPYSVAVSGASGASGSGGASGSAGLPFNSNGGAKITFATFSDVVISAADGGTGSLDVVASSGPYPKIGSASINLARVTLPPLTLPPAAPTGVSGTRVSDTQVRVSWTQNAPTNGLATGNAVRQSVNGGSFADVASIAASTSVTVGAAANRRTLYQVAASNAKGTSAWSASSAAVYTTPAAPTNVAAAKDASLDINVSWTPHVAFTQHTHVVEHGTVTGGTTTWDSSPLASVASGTTSYTDTAPDASKVHVYRISAKNTDTHALQSAKVTSNSVQLLAPPNKPTFPALGPYEDKGKDFVLTWTHNPVDSTSQKYYEVGYSTDGGTTYSTTGKVTSTVSSYTIDADTYSAGDALTVRVRTWGQATTGGSDSAGASPWADTASVTFKTRPVVTITAPEDAGTWAQAELDVALGFSQAEDATFVQATIVLSQDSTDLETTLSTTFASTTMDTSVADGGSYTLTVTVLDSNGLVSDAVTSTFTVEYTDPVAAVVVVTYLSDSGIAQIDLAIPDPGDDEAAAVAVTITRTIDGARETIVTEYPITDSPLTILDMTPTIHGTNRYTVTTISEDGATVDVVTDLVTVEDWWAFLSTGDGFSTIVNFFGNLQVSAAPARALALVETAGRSRPIALFGATGTLEVSGSADLDPRMGSTPQEVEQFILAAGIVCYRDPTGRRVFGAMTGSVASPNTRSSAFSFKVSEAS